MARLATSVLAGALIRRAEQSGGSAMVLAKGDAVAGAMLLLIVERGSNPRFFERGIGADGRSALIASGPEALAGDVDATAYWRRRRASDPDLWVIELDIPDGQRFAAETLGLD
jgi:hypothetical protein